MPPSARTTERGQHNQKTMKTNPTNPPTAGNPRPPELLLSGVEIDATIAHMKRQGAHVAALEPERGCTDLWRARLSWDEARP